MTRLTLELQPELYARLVQEATRLGRPVEVLVVEWLERSYPPSAPAGERERAIAVLREAGLLTELGPELKQMAAQATMSLEAILTVFVRVGGKPLSEIALLLRSDPGSG